MSPASHHSSVVTGSWPQALELAAPRPTNGGEFDGPRQFRLQDLVDRIVGPAGEPLVVVLHLQRAAEGGHGVDIGVAVMGFAIDESAIQVEDDGVDT